MSSATNIHLAQLQPSTLREQARAALRASIITGEIAAGQMYSVGTVAERLGVSATPIREALSDLAHHGLVVVVRNRGFIVPELEGQDLEEIFDLRLLLEVPALERAAGRVSDEDLAACRYDVDRGKRAAAAGDLAGFLEADREFHLRLLSSLGNGRLVEMVDTLRDQMRLYGSADVTAGGGLVASAEEHEKLLEAVEANDSTAARDLMRLHLEHTRDDWASRSQPASRDAAGLG